MAQKIQPMGFLGCWEATRAPTTANDTEHRECALVHPRPRSHSSG